MSEPSRPPRRRSNALVVGVALIAVTAAAAIGFALGRSDDPDTAGGAAAGSSTRSVPGADSVEVGFARDMSVHHAQAVEMADIIRSRTDDPDLELMATDTVLTQQAQIGIMRGWLDVWGQPATDAVFEPMSWMGMAMGAEMPGMASADDVVTLATLPVPESEIRFLQLMIRHHEGGVEMARHVGDGAVAPVRHLARSIIGSQTAEIAAMREMLAARGASA